MKIYAVVIGKKESVYNKHTRYVAYEPFVRSNFCAGNMPLAVYGNLQRAKEAKQEILKTCGHTNVYIIRFYTKALKGKK